MPERPAKSHILSRFRRSRRQVGDLGSQAEEHIEQHFVSRLEKLKPVRRFVIGWLVLLCLLIGGLIVQNLALSGYYQTLRPVPGGIYNEGVPGRFTNANPMFATSDADVTVSRLVFAGLLKADGSGRLVGDLATGYDVGDHGMTYTVHLRPHLTWQDGQPLTSRDVAFTYDAIQNPDVQSPLRGSWEGVGISTPDTRTVVFRLPDPLVSFPYNLTSGIVPEHLLSRIPAVDLRSADFNTVHPVGAGPFAWQAVQVNGNGDPDTEQEQIALVPFEHYHAGSPKLQEFVVQAFASRTKLIEAFESKQLTAVESLDQVPPQLRNDGSMVQHDLLLRAATMVFFKTSEGVLADQQVRLALVRATDVQRIMSDLGYTTHAVDEPLLKGQLGYDPSLAQAPFNLKAADKLLDKDGWKTGKDGLRSKRGQPLAFTLTADNTAENRMVTRELQRQWRELGVRLNVRLQNSGDFQSTLSYHDYDAVLDGIAIGSDPDVFVYWDSSQADIRSANRLNLSEYKDPVADVALEAGRTRLDPTLRIIKYRPFLEAWQRDAPAVGLYQPRLLYLTNGPVAGLSDSPINAPADRFINVNNWEIRQAKVTD
ncbi:MAG: ABC transporter substrate-binding protein [Candidatus Saccharimonadales bacterium]